MPQNRLERGNNSPHLYVLYYIVFIIFLTVRSVKEFVHLFFIPVEALQQLLCNFIIIILSNSSGVNILSLLGFS